MTDLPWFIGATIVSVDIVVAAILWAGLRSAAHRTGYSRAAANRLGLTAAIGMALWLPIAVTISVIFVAPMPAGFGSGVAFLSLLLVPVVIACAFLAGSGGRRLAHAIPQHWLIGAQVYRVVGAVFLAAAVAGVLPMWFAGPAAYGDILTGATAPFVAWWAYKRGIGWKPAVLIWNLVGLADFIVALGLGSQTFFVGASQSAFGAAEISTGPLRELPLVLIPQFLVPAGIILHLLSLWKLATERSSDSSAHPGSLQGASNLRAGR